MRNGRDRLLKAALELFTEHGFHAVSIRDIAERAGLSNPALYQHFSGKLDLGEALYLDCYDRLILAVESRLSAELSPIDKLGAYVRASVDLHSKRPSPLPYLEDHQRLFARKAVAIYADRAVSSRLALWIREGQRLDQIRKDVPASFLVGLCIGQLTKWIMMSEMDLAPRDQAGDHLIVLLNAALRPPLPN